jgi:hypothetical protein
MKPSASFEEGCGCSIHQGGYPWIADASRNPSDEGKTKTKFKKNIQKKRVTLY